MGQLEEGFEKLHWPKLVKEVEIITDHPGYRYKFFNNFKELDLYFTDLCGPSWQTQEWAVFWKMQHIQSQYDDRKESEREKQNRVTPHGNSGPRRDSKQIKKWMFDYLDTLSTIPSTRKIATFLIKTYDINLTHYTTWRYVKQYKKLKQIQEEKLS